MKSWNVNKMILKKQIKQIKEFGIDLDWNSAFGGKSKGNRHLFRIVNKALELSKNYECNKKIIEASAWLHDTNLEKTISGSTLANKEKIIRFLTKIDVCKEDQPKIIQCIEAHDGRIKAKTIEAKIVHDADTLEKMGSLGILRETWKRSQLGWNTEKIAKHLKKHIKKREGRLYTQEAKSQAKELNSNLDIFFDKLTMQLK